MIEFDGLPFLLGMARRAFVAQTALVNVVLAVTCNTSGRRFRLGKKRLDVAADAFHPFMLANQLEFGLRVVIEFNLFPALGGMAGLAFLAISPAVLVVLAVARHARLGNAFEFTQTDVTF